MGMRADEPPSNGLLYRVRVWVGRKRKYLDGVEKNKPKTKNAIEGRKGTM
jgi:hypothetical protein